MCSKDGYRGQNGQKERNLFRDKTSITNRLGRDGSVKKWAETAQRRDQKAEVRIIVSNASGRETWPSAPLHLILQRSFLS